MKTEYKWALGFIIYASLTGFLAACMRDGSGFQFFFGVSSLTSAIVGMVMALWKATE